MLREAVIQGGFNDNSRLEVRLKASMIQSSAGPPTWRYFSPKKYTKFDKTAFLVMQQFLSKNPCFSSPKNPNVPYIQRQVEVRRCANLHEIDSQPSVGRLFYLTVFCDEEHQVFQNRATLF